MLLAAHVDGSAFGCRAEHPHGSSGCYIETRQLTPADGQGCDAVTNAALPGFPSHTACKSYFCNEAKRNNCDTAAPGARGTTAGLQEAQPSASPKAAGQDGLPLLPKPVFWLVLLLLSLASCWHPDTSGQCSAMSCGVWQRGAMPALQHTRTLAQMARRSMGSHCGTWGRAGSLLPPASIQWSRCAQMLGILGDSRCGGGSQGEMMMRELHLTPPWVMDCTNLSHPCSH